MKRMSATMLVRTGLLLLATLLFAQTSFASRTPRLLIAEPGESPIALRRLDIDARITSGVAVTTVVMEFFNPNRRQLEGELQFPLLDGQQIVGFALDIDGKLRDAVPIEKTRGQQVFEDITRQRVDPGLLQVTQGNNFKVRVYPIPAQRSRTVAVTYSESLATRQARGIYRLPLEYAATVDEFTLDVSVRGSTSRPIASGEAAQGLSASSDANEHRLQSQQRNHVPRGILEIAVALPPGPRTLVQSHGGRDYFYAEIPVGTVKAARTLPRTVGIVWDSSLSGASRNHARELTLLDAYFSRLRNGEVRLTRIRNSAEPVETFTITDGKWHTLRRALESTVYDGATNLGAFEPDESVGEYLMFTDGLDNFGDGTLPQPRVPMYTISSSAQSHPAWLKHIAHNSGGRHLDLLVESPRAAVTKIARSFERIRSIGAEGATDVIAVSPYPVNGTLTLVGVLVERTATVRVELGLAGKRSRIVSVPVSGAATRGTLAASFWARARVAELEPEYAVHRAAILSLGRSFRIVTRETSLIVLETVQDYVRFEVEPPGELAAEYERVRRATAVARPPDPRQKIEHVVALLDEKERWWRRDFSKSQAPAISLRDLGRPMEDRASGMGGSLSRQAPAAAQSVDEAKRATPAPSLAARKDAKVETETRLNERSKSAPSSRVEADAFRVVDKELPSAAAYLPRLRGAAASELYGIYLDERAGHAASPTFFVDAADLLYANGLPELALRVLSNLAELDLENRQNLRTLGDRLMQAAQAPLAVTVFRKVLEISPEEPQSFRDLGLAYAAAGDHQRAVATLYEVVLRPWHSRFPDIELIALADMNAIVARHPGRLNLSRIDARLLRNLPLDVRVVLTWGADNTDVNLVVTDPNGQSLYPGSVSDQGGRLSQNFAGGYGPEEYSLRKAKPGKYRFAAHFVSHRRQVAGAGSTQAHLRVYTAFGTAGQIERSYSVQLPHAGSSVVMAEIDVPAALD